MLIIFMIIMINNLLFPTCCRNMIKINLTPYVYSSRNTNTLEHIFPKSLIKDKKYENDMHNIFRCNQRLNTLRSNFKFMDENEVIFDDKWRKLDEYNYVNTKKKLFIPNNQSKGIISRSIMYMSHNYNYSYTKVIDSNILIDWCLKFPPNKNEYVHNIIVYKYQKNKNKFIDLYHQKNYKEMICDLFTQ